MLRLGIVEMRGSTVIRLRPCVTTSTPPAKHTQLTQPGLSQLHGAHVSTVPPRQGDSDDSVRRGPERARGGARWHRSGGDASEQPAVRAAAAVREDGRHVHQGAAAHFVLFFRLYHMYEVCRKRSESLFFFHGRFFFRRPRTRTSNHE